MTIFGTAGNDNLSGTSASDEFDVSQGGNDTVKGRAGDEIIYFGSAFTAADTVFGGKGVDAITLEGDYSAGLAIGGNIDSVEQISCIGSFNYRVTLTDAAVAAGQLMNMGAGTLAAGFHLILDARTESDGKYFVTGSAGDDTLRTGAGNDQVFGGAGNDTIRPGGGTDTVFGGVGTDTFIFGTGQLDGTDRIDGGADGNDTVRLDGDYSAGVTFQAQTLTGVFQIELVEGNDYTLDCSNMKSDPPTGFNIDGTALGVGDVLHFDGTGVIDYGFFVRGGDGNDVIVGGKNYDTYLGGGGVDTMTAGNGNSVYSYESASDSAGPNFDTIIGFDAVEDFFFPVFPAEGDVMHTTGYDGKIAHGALSSGSFNADLAAAIGAGEMAEDHAVLFRPDSGDFAGALFLIIDANDVAGYQANNDIVVRLTDASHMGSFDFSNFGTAG